MPSELQAVAEALGLEKYRRHIFLCADQTEPKCAAREKGLKSWEYLKRRLKELKFAGPGPLVYRSKVNCLRVCQQGPIAVVYPERGLVSFLHARGAGTNYPGAFDQRQGG